MGTCNPNSQVHVNIQYEYCIKQNSTNHRFVHKSSSEKHMVKWNGTNKMGIIEGKYIV